jgi:hypothetical protein
MGRITTTMSAADDIVGLTNLVRSGRSV